MTWDNSYQFLVHTVWVFIECSSAMGHVLALNSSQYRRSYTQVKQQRHRAGESWDLSFNLLANDCTYCIESDQKYIY